MIAIVATVSLLIAAPSAAPPASTGLPAPWVEAVTARATERGANPEVLLAPAIEAARAGLPGQLVAQKVLEGLAKGAPTDLICTVSRGLVERLASSQAVLVQAERGGLTVPEQARTALLADLASSLQEGIPPGALRDLVQSAQQARAQRAEGVVSGARTLADLHRRGVAVTEALPLAEAMAGRPPDPGLPDRIAALYDAWRKEGGAEPRAFVEEARQRVRDGASLEGMVDYFAESPDRLIRIPHTSDQDGNESSPSVNSGKALGHDKTGKALGHVDAPGLSDGGPPGQIKKVKKDRKSK